MGGPRWTEEEDSLVRALYPTHGAAWDGWSRLLPGKTRRQVTYRANRMGVYSRAGLRHRRPRWSAGEDAALRDAVAAGLRTRRELDGAVPGKGADASRIVRPDVLTHERPDSWERIADELDAWCDRVDVDRDACGEPRELARRIRRLAEREDGR